VTQPDNAEQSLERAEGAMDGAGVVRSSGWPTVIDQQSRSTWMRCATVAQSQGELAEKPDGYGARKAKAPEGNAEGDQNERRDPLGRPAVPDNSDRRIDVAGRLTVVQKRTPAELHRNRSARSGTPANRTPLSAASAAVGLGLAFRVWFWLRGRLGLQSVLKLLIQQDAQPINLHTMSDRARLVARRAVVAQYKSRAKCDRRDDHDMNPAFNPPRGRCFGIVVNSCVRSVVRALELISMSVHRGAARWHLVPWRPNGG
jgi:hypothetical protein